jgi:hypothetical protein
MVRNVLIGLTEFEEGLLLMDIPYVKEICCLSQLRVVYCAYGKFLKTCFGPSKGKIFR